MIKEFSFRFDELVINRKLIEESLGFSGGLPEPFDAYLEEIWGFSNGLDDIRATYKLSDDFEIEVNQKSIADGHEFQLGKRIRKEMAGSERIAFFICTAGSSISEKSQSLMYGDDPSLGYVYDVMGSFIAEAAGNKMQSILKEEVSKNGNEITNRYSPGYCEWPVDDQPKLFSQFPKNVCGVSLTPSHLMNPVKSISGIIGIGKEVKFRDYMCALCNNADCIYRIVRKNNL